MESTEWNRRVTTLAEADTGERRSLQAHDHAALIYWSRQEFLDTIVPYIMEGLRDGDLVVHVAHDEPVEPLVEALEAAGADVEGARARGQLQLLKAAEAFAPEGRFEVEAAMAGLGETIEAAQAAGHGRIRFSVDLSYLLSGAPGVDDFLVFDSRANDEIFPRHPFICICAYDASRGAGHLVDVRDAPAGVRTRPAPGQPLLPALERDLRPGRPSAALEGALQRRRRPCPSLSGARQRH